MDIGNAYLGVVKDSDLIDLLGITVISYVESVGAILQHRGGETVALYLDILTVKDNGVNIAGPCEGHRVASIDHILQALWLEIGIDICILVTGLGDCLLVTLTSGYYLGSEQTGLIIGIGGDSIATFTLHQQTILIGISSTTHVASHESDGVLNQVAIIIILIGILDGKGQGAGGNGEDVAMLIIGIGLFA